MTLRVICEQPLTSQSCTYNAQIYSIKLTRQLVLYICHKDAEKFPLSAECVFIKGGGGRGK